MAEHQEGRSVANEDQEAYEQMVQALSNDMPLVMHGSGDVPPPFINPESARLLSELTANYITDLVHAAVDAHVLLNDGPQPLPPRPMEKPKTTPLPAPPTVPPGDKNPVSSKRRRRRSVDDFWDEDLPKPKIKGRPPSDKTSNKNVPMFENVPVDEWVGVSGVDFWSRRARSVHVSTPSAMGTPCFLFPICHDVGLYGKCLELQASRRTLSKDVLANPVVANVLRGETTLQGPGALRKIGKKDGEEEPEDTDSEGDAGATWPGLDSMLPLHKHELSGVSAAVASVMETND